MKLNKPSLTEEQSILEDYVDFLLLDSANIHPIKKDNASQKVQHENEEHLSEKVSKAPIKKSLATVSKNKTQQHDNAKFIEEPEEEQLKEWNDLIQEKSHDVVKFQESKPFEKKEDHKLLKKESNLIVEEKKLMEQTPELTKEYLPEEKDKKLANVEKLLARISLATPPQNELKPETTVDNTNENSKNLESNVITETSLATFEQREIQKNKSILPDIFQTLILHIAKLSLAVPLLKLGGIVKFSQDDVTPLVGSPDWFIGLVPNDRGSLMVVDTQKYLMPEKTVNENKDEYEYLIVLDNSNWALACHSVGGAKNLTHDDVRWSEKNSRRPWFAGMVVEHMSALIEVDELINMLADNIVE